MIIVVVRGSSSVGCGPSLVQMRALKAARIATRTDAIELQSTLLKAIFLLSM